MIRIASDKTIALLTWFFLLGILSFLSREELPILPQRPIEKIDLNRATLEDFMQVPKLSVKIATSILLERNKRGSFKAFEELDVISGVGPKTLEKLKAFLKI